MKQMEQQFSGPRKKENRQSNVENIISPEEKEFGKEFFKKVKEFIKHDWEETLRLRKGKNMEKEEEGEKKGKRKAIESYGKGFVTGLIVLATLSMTPGKKILVELINGARKWNPGNLYYRIPDTIEYSRKGVSRQEEMKNTETSMQGYFKNTTEFRAGRRTFRFYDSTLGLICASRNLKEKNGNARIEITDENTQKLLAFEYDDLKPPKDPEAFREFISFYVKRTLEHRRAKQRKEFFLRAIVDGKIDDPLVRRAHTKLGLLWVDSEKDYSVKEKEELAILHTLEESLSMKGISIGYPDSMLPYDQNSGPQNVEEFLAVAQTVLKDNLEYDPAVESWLNSDREGGAGIKEGEGNYVIDMYSANGTPVDVLLREKKSGVCRHYADAFAAVCQELKAMFPDRFENVYVTTSLSVFRAHKYNTVFITEAPDVLHAISYEPQDGDVGPFHNTPAFEILEQMYQRNYISKEDFYAAVTEYFAHSGVESRVDLLAFLDRLKGDGGEDARAAGRGVLDAVERGLNLEIQQEENPHLKASVLYGKHTFLLEVEEYRNAFGY